MWSSLITGFLVLIVLLIFIAQNTASTAFAFFGWHWSLPLGVAILLAAVGGGLLTVAVGTARILQLRREAKKSHAQALRATNPGVDRPRTPIGLAPRKTRADIRSEARRSAC
ncbi:hypothetical protein I551_7041 [Mycobacterium ulcerans str. Harvey]|uniref:Lipopolysaccharide assembly protein A domain-containing protein n=1 Tax=Mycobacterium ulcerans str. Harvey TaxID=1299332 RepID=A0ABN0QP75_MYCUL|nr:hypothetical protein I551_7041 [Mycobacterium ulcerans str. Harvey]